MKTVLLAIAGETPSRQALEYAIELCEKMKARLSILQVISVGKRKLSKSVLGAKMDNILKMFEKSMLEITFAESGETYEPPKLLQEIQNKGYLESENGTARVILKDLKVVPGKISKEISGYIRDHREIVLAVYDDAAEPINRKKKMGRGVPSRIIENIKVPMVTIHHQ
jgi:nucleotide-binding universal stress UspA family protein